jgi:hypothetical protein
VKALGDRAVWLENGCVKEIGDVERVVTSYLIAMAQKDSAYLSHQPAVPTTPGVAASAPEVVESIPNVDHRFGDRRAEVLGIQLLDRSGYPLGTLEPDTAVIVRISVRAKDELRLPIVGFMMRNHLGIDFAGTNTTRENSPLSAMSPGEVRTVDFHIDLPALYPTTFSFSPAIADGTLEQYSICDWVDNAIAVPMMQTEAPIYGHLHLRCRVEVNARLGHGQPAVVQR